MQNLKSKLFEDVKSQTLHTVSELTLDDLIDPFILKKEFNLNNSFFKNFLQDELASEEEEETTLLVKMELFKRDMLLNFTNSQIGKEIPNMSNNHIFDKFNNEYNSTYHNEFHTKVAHVTNFLLSIFLNLTTKEIEKSKILTLLSKLQEELCKDSVAQQKFFTVFSIVNNLVKILTIEKNLPEFFKLIDAYTKFLNNFLKDSRFTVYLVKDHIVELANLIVEKIINCENDSLTKDYGVSALFKLAVCFKIPDLYLNFIESLLRIGNFRVNLKEELNEFIEGLFDDSVDLFSGVSDKTTIDLKYRENIKLDSTAVFATDGVYIYIHQNTIGLLKVGTGLHNSIKGKIYSENSTFFKEASGSLAYCCGRLYFRSSQTAPKPFVLVNTNDLSLIEKTLHNEHFFVDKQSAAVNLQYTLQGHTLLNTSRSTEASKLISDGRYLYLVSIIGELRTTEEEYKCLYPNNCLINVDLFDPLDNYNLITSFPIVDPRNILGQSKSSSLIESFGSSIITDGKTIFFIQEEPVKFSIINRAITEVVKDPPRNDKKIFLDPKNSLLWALNLNSTEDEFSSLLYSKINLNSFITGLSGDYHGFKSFNHFNLKESATSIYETEALAGVNHTTTQAVKEKEVELYEFFFKEKSKITKKEDTCTNIEINTVVSLVLNSLGQSALFNLNPKVLHSEDILSHIFSLNTLNLNSSTIQKFVKLYSHYKKSFFDDSNLKIELKYFILSGFFKLFNAILRQIQILRFDEFKSFKEDFGCLQEVVEDSVNILIELYISGDHCKGLTIDLISQSLLIAENYRKIFSIDFPNLNMFVDIITKNSENFADLNNTIIRAAGNSGKNLYSSRNIENLLKILELVITKNSNLIHVAISGFLDHDSSSEIGTISENVCYDKKFENLLTPLFKIIFNTHLEITKCKHEQEKNSKLDEFNDLVCNFEKLFALLSGHISTLIQGIDIKLKNSNFISASAFESISQKISEFINKNSFAFKFYFASVSFLNIFTDEKIVIFKTWHYVYETLVLFDRSFSGNKKTFLELKQMENQKEGKIAEHQEFNLEIESPHPITKEIKINKEYIFKEECSDVYIEFDPLSYKDPSTEFEFIIKTKNSEVSHKFTNGFEDKCFTEVKSISLAITAPPGNSYGFKCLIHNKIKYKHYANSLQSLIIGVITRSIKTFFFFNYKTFDKLEKNLEDLLQSKLFEGGINELLDLETSSEEYKQFARTLKSSSNYLNFERRLSQEGEDHEEPQLPPFEIEEIIYKENFSVEKFIQYAQISLKMRFPWINLGGDNADKIVRAAFAVLVKQEKMYEMITEVVEKICEEEEKRDQNASSTALSTKELSEIENFEFLLLSWSEVSRLRQWYQEQIKDLAEANSEDFDKQNQDFVGSVLDKCKFLFTVNPPKGKGKKKKTNLNFLHIFAQNEILSSLKIDNDVARSNMIKFKKCVMHGKIEEKNSETENLKKIVNSLTNCVKLTKVSIDSLRNALRIVNTRAKFREISLSLINSLLCEIESDDTKLIIVKQIIYTLRKTSGKRLISIDDEIKSGSSSLISAIKLKFHNFIQIIFANLLKSESISIISGYIDCLYWNLSARNQVVLLDINLLNNLFLHSPNAMINNAWTKITKIGNKNVSSKKSNRYEFNENSLGVQLLEFFNIYSSMIIGRIIDETHSTANLESQANTGFFRMKSSVFENSFDDLVKSICDILSTKINEYLSNYQELISNPKEYLEKFLPEENYENFSRKYFDENLLNSFLLLLYKFIINQSSLVIKHMKNPEFLASIFVLLRYTSSKNRFTLCNILKVYLKNLSEEDFHNVVFFLRKQELFHRVKFIEINHHDDKFIPKNFLITYLLNIVSELRGGIYTEDKVSLSSQYEESACIVSLVKSVYNDEKWRGTLENVFSDFLARDVLISPILSILNGDFEDFHYGAYIAIKYKSNKPKTITVLMQEKSEERNSLTYGHILGFCESEVKISELKSKKEFKDFLYNKLKFRRDIDDKYVLIMAVSNDSYNKSKLKNNDVEFQVRNINDIVLVPTNDVKISSENLLKEIVKKFQEKLKLIKSRKNSYLDYYLLVQLSKSLNSIYSEEMSKDVRELLISCFSLEDIKPLLEKSSKLIYLNNTANQYKFINMLKLYLDNKPSTGLVLNKIVEKQKELISIEALRFSRSIRIYKEELTNGKIFKILSTSNLTVDTDSFKKLDQFQLVRMADPSLKKYLNCLIYCTASEDLLQKINKIDDINIVFMFSQEDELYAKANIIHPYIILKADKKDIEDLFREMENKISVSSFREVDIEKEHAYLDQIGMTKESIMTLRNLNVMEKDSSENDTIDYSPSFEIDKNEIVSSNLSVMNSLSRSFKENDFSEALQNMALHYLRTFLVNVISTRTELISPGNYEFINKQYKLAFFDNCQYAIITWFDYSRFKNLISLFEKLVEKGIEFQSESSDKSLKINFIEISPKSKIFNSYNFSMSEAEIQNEILTELLELYLRKQNDYALFNCRHSYIKAIGETINISLITVNNEYEVFNQYLLKLRDLLNEYGRFYASHQDESLNLFVNDLKLFENMGLNKLVRFLNASLLEEKTLSSRTKILFNFVWEYSLLITDIFRKTFKEDKVYSYQNTSNIDKLKVCLEQMNLLYYKARDVTLKNDSILSIEDLKKQLISEIEVICNSKYILEKKLDFGKVAKYNLESANDESKGKIYITARKSADGSFKVSDIIGDNEKLSFKMTKEENLLIANKDVCTNELWMCGYNEKRRMGNAALNDYEYVYVPIQCTLDGNVRIRKVLNCYQSTIVLTYDNKIYVAGEGINSGLVAQSITFTLDNQWNDIAKKETIIDIYTNENIAFIMVTNKNVYASGYNGSNIFGNIVPSGNYTNGITKLSTPFKSSKVIQVSLGYGHMMFLLDDGTVYGIGCNCSYELNFETTSAITQLTKIPFPPGMKPIKISCGYNASLFLMKERDNKVYLYSCGDNGYGQNGQGSNSTKRFKKCIGVEDIQWKYVKMGYYCSCGITTDNKLYTWGYNGYYNLSHQDTNYHYQPDHVEFYKDMTVLDADINEKNLVVRCIDTDGQMKIFTSGYNGYACMGIGSHIESYNKVPLEVTTFKDSFIQKVFLTGSAYNVSFIKSNITAIGNSFEFKCTVCEKLSSETLHVLPKEGKNTKVCITCLKSDGPVADGVCYAIRNINIATSKEGNIDSIMLPDLSHLSALTESKLDHIVACYECKKLIGKGNAYVSADKTKNIIVAFCEECYSNTAYFEDPAFVYCLKYAVEFSNLPHIDSIALLGYDISNKQKLSSFKNLNEEGLKEFYKENESLIEKIFNEFDEIKSEHILEYLKITEIEDKAKSIREEIKKVPCLEKLTESQLKIIQLTIAKLDASMKSARNFVSMDISNLIKEIYISNLNYLSKISRMDLLDKLIYEGTAEVSSDSCSVNISRGKSIKFKQRVQVDCQGIYTIFGQIFNEAKKIPITQYNCRKNNRLFRVYLRGEGATDAGGPYREMMNILCDELQSPYLDLFIPTANNRSSSGQDREKWTINPTAKSNLHLEMFKTLGRFFGFAIRSTGYLNLNFPSFIWKQILNQPLDLQDLEKIDIHTANFLSDLRFLEEKGIDEEQFDYIYDQQFTTILSNGKEVELMSGGNEKKLTYSNAKEYVKIVLKTRFEECAVQIEAIKAGLFQVINPEITLFLNWKELEEKVCGNLIVDVDWLKKNTIYESWSETDQIITWFWQAFRKFTNDERILYLKFVWGRSRLPLTEDAYYHKHKITKAYSSHTDISLPLSHTCFFTIDIPAYSSYEILYKKLLYAIRFCSEIDNDNTAGEALEDL